MCIVLGIKLWREAAVVSANLATGKLSCTWQPRSYLASDWVSYREQRATSDPPPSPSSLQHFTVTFIHMCSNTLLSFVTLGLFRVSGQLFCL